jgi:hypothetical protein
MAKLSNEDRVKIWQEWMRVNTEPVSLNKGQVRVATNVVDDEIETAVEAISNSLPPPVRAALSNKQIALFLQLVIKYRLGVL